MTAVAIPSIGIAMEEALLVKWLKQPGDQVAATEAVAEIETDKATMDLESPVAGRLGPHLFEPGAIVPVGTVIVEVLIDGEEAAVPAPAEAAADRSGTGGESRVRRLRLRPGTAPKVAGLTR